MEMTAKMDDAKLQRLLIKVIKQGNPTVVKRLRKERDEVMTAAETEWPVKTGKSKRGLGETEKVVGEYYRVGIQNRIKYAYYIKADILGGKSPWQELVVKPIKKKQKAIASDIGKDLVKLMDSK